MAERIQTPITGISTTSTYEDGATYSLVNLRPKNGALHPVPPRKVVQELSREYDIIFIHQNNDYQNWIGVINDGDSSSVYWDIKNDPKSITTDVPGAINSVQQVGNTLSLITTDNVFYLLYQDNNYRFLGEIPDLPVINMGTTDSMPVIGMYFKDEYGSNSITPGNFIEATKGLINRCIEAIMNEYYYPPNTGSTHPPQGPLLFDACFVRYALRLYDGTLTKHSPPILIMPTRFNTGTGSGYRGSTKSIQYSFQDGRLTDESSIGVYGYRVSVNYDFTLENKWESWKEIIQSIDIFLSQPLGISNSERVRGDMPTNDQFIPYSFDLIKPPAKEQIDNVKDTSTFYFLKSIPLGSKNIDKANPDVFPTRTDILKIEDLIHREAMTDDSFSHNKYGAAVSYAYNGRLHLSNIKATIFGGFSPDYFLWHNQGGAAGDYNGYAGTGRKVFDNLLIEVEIYTGLSNEKTYQYLKGDYQNMALFMGAFISYPDPRARRITIYRYSDSKWYKTFSAPLEAHGFLNLAYYLMDNMNPIREVEAPEEIELPDTSKPLFTSTMNTIKVSELNNPLVFPNINTYQVGTGAILAMATNAMNVSDRNFGQFPLYVFTTRGIWTLNVGSGEVVYSALSAPVSMETPISPVVGETPYGVVFASQRGLMIINGQSVDFISPQIEQVPTKLNIEMNDHCDDVVFRPETRKFSELLKDLSALVYNPYENELIANVPNTELNYVLNLYDRTFYQSTEKIDLVVGNALPELFIVRDGKLKDYAASDSPIAHVGFITRPIQYGTPDIKRLERVILRALIYNATKFDNGKFPLYMVHYSMDRVNFKALTGFPIKDGHNRDLDSGLLSRPKFSYGLFTIAGLMSEESEIEYLDTAFDKEYNNTKMR